MTTTSHGKGPGLYVHVPFCLGKCPYCAFFSLPGRSLVSRWIEALKKEVLYYKDRWERFDTLYFGGGTPSALHTSELAGIMEHLYRHYDFEPDVEITLEANPRDLTRERIRALQTMGFNRISLGVQSLDDATLSFLGRNHTAADAKRALSELKEAGLRNISIDLIYGTGGQSLQQWLEVLQKAVLLEPAHFSCYQLSIEKKTLFGRWMERGLLTPLTDRQEHAWFHATSRFLEKKGYIQYEVSSFAGQKALYSRHNYKYWTHVPYLGLGPSAHSFSRDKRWWNVASIRKYCAALEDDRLPVEASEYLSEEQLRFESIFLGLRTRNGIARKKILGDAFEMLLEEFQDKGFVEIRGERILPTRKGLLVGDHLACRLAGYGFS